MSEKRGRKREWRELGGCLAGEDLSLASPRTVYTLKAVEAIEAAHRHRSWLIWMAAMEVVYKFFGIGDIVHGLPSSTLGVALEAFPLDTVFDTTTSSPVPF